MANEKAQKLADMMKKLDEISSYFEGEEVDIDDGIKMYEEGVKLATEIKKQLRSYELKINEIKEMYLKEEE
jgi:exodeoxyribonuclease VII small subunit